MNAIASDDAFDALVSALAMDAHVGELLELCAEPEYALEGKIWTMADQSHRPAADVDSMEARSVSAKRIFVPSQRADSWAAGLADPGKQWRTGYSAKTLAECWQAADDFPSSVRKVFERSLYEQFQDLEMLLAIPEWKVPLQGGSRASQTDLFVLARATDGLITIAVEGKVDEPFDKLVSEWLSQPADVTDESVQASDGKTRRLDYLCETLELDRGIAEGLRYQLLHRTASALIEARRFMASRALMLVHSFSPDALWFDDYLSFAKAIDAKAEKDSLIAAGERNGVELFLGWCSGEQVWRK